MVYDELGKDMEGNIHGLF